MTTRRLKPTEAAQAKRSLRRLPPWFVVFACGVIFLTSLGVWYFVPERSAAQGQLSVDFRVDVNHADVTTLAGLPGLGEVMGQKIIDSRNRQGRFASPQDLTRVQGIGQDKLAQLLPWITCGQGVAPPSLQPANSQPSHTQLRAQSLQKSGDPDSGPPLVEDSNIPAQLTQ